MAKIPSILKVKVTQKHIDKGKQGATQGDPIWLALRKLCKEHNVECFVTNTVVTFFRRATAMKPRRYVKYEVDPIGQQFMRDFDDAHRRWWPVKPCVVTLTRRK